MFSSPVIRGQLSDDVHQTHWTMLARWFSSPVIRGQLSNRVQARWLIPDELSSHPLSSGANSPTSR